MENNKEHKPQAIIEIPDHGPIKVTGNFIITDSRKDIVDKPGEAFLCSCGRSANKPYCDDSHKK
jgi:CDGSH-type Zn-finger protein